MCTLCRYLVRALSEAIDPHQKDGICEYDINPGMRFLIMDFTEESIVFRVNNTSGHSFQIEDDSGCSEATRPLAWVHPKTLKLKGRSLLLSGRYSNNDVQVLHRICVYDSNDLPVR
jgi:hypothetical protein